MSRLPLPTRGGTSGRRRALLLAAVISCILALLITYFFRPQPLEEQLLRLQVEQALPAESDLLAAESVELQALFLAYADDPVLLAKARLAMLRYPEIARPIFAVYGESDAFRDVLRTYGEDVLLPIHYFVENEIFTLELMRGLSDKARSALLAVRRLWDAEQSPAAAAEAPSDVPRDAPVDGQLTAEQRGWYAIHFVDTEGYSFLGQFVMSPTGEVGWLQTERVLEAINSLFAGGLRGLETKIRREEPLALGDVGWAAADVAIGVGAFKLLRAGRMGAATGSSLTFSERTAALSAGLWRGTVVGTRVLKYGAPAVLAYVAVRHPSVLNSLMGRAAEHLGLPVEWVQAVGWSLILFPLVLLLRWLAVPIAWLLSACAAALRTFSGLRRRYG